MSILEAILSELGGIKEADAAIEGVNNEQVVPSLVISCSGSASTADRVIKQLIAGTPSIHTDPFWRANNKIVVNPVCIPLDCALTIGRALRTALSAGT